MGSTICFLDAFSSPEGRANQRWPLTSLRLQSPPRLWFKVDVGCVVFQDDVVNMMTCSLRQPHASIGEGHKPPGLIIRYSTILLYASDILQRYGLSSLVIFQVRQVDSRKSVPTVKAMLLDAKVDDGADGREVTPHRVRCKTLGQKVIA